MPDTPCAAGVARGVLGKEEAAGLRLEPGCGWSQPVALDPGCACVCVCVFSRGYRGQRCPPASSLRRLSARTHSAGSPTRGRRDTGSPARLDRGTLHAPTSHRQSRQGGKRRADRSQQIRQRRLEERGTAPRQHRRSGGELGRGRKRKQLLGRHTEAARKRFQGRTGLRLFPCQVSYDTGKDHVQNQQNGPESQDRRFLTPGGGSRRAGALCCQPRRAAGEARGWLRRRRIHVVAGEAVGVLDDPLLVDVHEDLLAADGTDAVGEVLGGHPRGAVELSEGRAEGER